MANQIKNHFQLEADMPVNKYKHDVKPKRGISEKFRVKPTNDRITPVNQKAIVASFTAGV